MEQNNMEIKIKNNNEYIPATWDVVDGVMIVSPKEEKVDITQFKDGDVVVYHYGEDASTIAILQGEVDTIGEYLFIEDYCGIDSTDGLWIESDYTDAATDVRFATEEEKQKLFNALAKEGKTWDAEKKAVVDLKWKPNVGDKYNHPMCSITDDGIRYGSATDTHTDSLFDKRLIKQNLAFKTKEECEAFCERLNQAINNIKP